MTDDEVRRLLKHVGRGVTAIRNRALIATMYRAGLRVSEALASYPKDVDAVDGVVRVLHGKGDRARTVALDAEALALLGRWADVSPTPAAPG